MFAAALLLLEAKQERARFRESIDEPEPVLPATTGGRK